ncbi:MAG: hypothetical protein A2Y65_06080 [Deltaproteobacteria bacterium RBG_13_52_11]|nr:MAG: hypothetical protein A2Y65_06080 [Deltaproteobacteria bacterium RBG_13_52_11]
MQSGADFVLSPWGEEDNFLDKGIDFSTIIRYFLPEVGVEKMIFFRLFKNAQMQGPRNAEE